MMAKVYLVGAARDFAHEMGGIVYRLAVKPSEVKNLSGPMKMRHG
jgi:hypothetical protein